MVTQPQIIDCAWTNGHAPGCLAWQPETWLQVQVWMTPSKLIQAYGCAAMVIACKGGLNVCCECVSACGYYWLQNINSIFCLSILSYLIGFLFIRIFSVLIPYFWSEFIIECWNTVNTVYASSSTQTVGRYSAGNTPVPNHWFTNFSSVVSGIVHCKLG